MEVRWFREAMTAPVFLYTLQKPVTSIQSDEYRDRARLFIDELSAGNLSLQLSNTQTSDSGLYTCSVIHKMTYAAAVVELKVTAVPLIPDSTHTITENEEIVAVDPDLSNAIAEDSSEDRDRREREDSEFPIWATVSLVIFLIFLAILAYFLYAKRGEGVKKGRELGDQTVKRKPLFSDNKEGDPKYQPSGNRGLPTPSAGSDHGTVPRERRKKGSNLGDQTGNNAGVFSDDKEGDPKYQPSGNRGLPTPSAGSDHGTVPRERRKKGSNLGDQTGNSAGVFSDDEEGDPKYQPSGNRGLPTPSAGSDHGKVPRERRKKGSNLGDQTGNSAGVFSDDEDSTSPKRKGSGGILKQPVQASLLQWFRVWISKSPVAADVTLDHDTASSSLLLSDDHKEVKVLIKQVENYSKPKKQEKWFSVLGTEGFNSGRHYWEVKVGGKKNWRLGVDEKFSEGKKTTNWTLGLRKGEFEEGGVSGLGNLCTPSQLKVVRVSLDMVGWQLSFFNAETRAEIYKISIPKVTGKLYPYFSPGNWDNDPLKICDLNPEK
ncbi:uncharacterized protein LOC121306741 [Polyodon spathula]|uniref:uncharacterized protein LOC121306741 n=1 Tax=Polyodon spathula TaxID=7913 RepID=UPI001B7E31BC|nr:uncharacterized protein LOC121306741 [Polyodon spathula]